MKRDWALQSVVDGKDTDRIISIETEREARDWVARFPSKYRLLSRASAGAWQSVCDESFRINAEHSAKLDALLILFNEKEQAAIAELAGLFDLNELEVVRQALRYYQLAISLNATIPNDSPGCGVIE